MFIILSSRIRNRVRIHIFFKNPSESVRLQDFEIRNNTNSTYTQNTECQKTTVLRTTIAINVPYTQGVSENCRYAKVGYWPPEVTTGFPLYFGIKIQGLFKDFQGP